MLEQPSRHFVRIGCCGVMRILRLLAKPSRHFGRVRSLSLWPCAHCGTLLGTLGVSDRSRCGTVLILGSFVRPSRHFGRVRSLSSWRGSNFHKQRQIEMLRRGLDKVVSCGPLVEIWHKNHLQRSCTGCTGILTRGLLQRSCQESSFREFVRRHLQKLSGDLL